MEYLKDLYRKRDIFVWICAFLGGLYKSIVYKKIIIIIIIIYKS